jgi:hypothetical protein
MPLDRDNDAERAARIAQTLKRLREVQQRVEETAIEAKERAHQISGSRKPARRPAKQSRGSE